jgi:ATP-binding cassette subfamily F protein 3
VLRDFKGSYVIISHDRYFLAEVSNKIWYIEDKKLKEYPGTYDEYEEWKERSMQQAAPAPLQQEVVQGKKNDGVKENSPDKELRKKQQHLGKTVKHLETTLAGLQSAREDTLAALADPGIHRDKDKFKELQVKLESAEKEILRVKSEWEKAFSELIELE